MNTDWQTYAAPLVVVATLVGFLIRAVRARKRGGGCASCASAGPKPRLGKKAD